MSTGSPARTRAFTHFLILSSLLSILLPALSRADVTELAPIIENGDNASPADALSSDPVLPTKRSSQDFNSGSSLLEHGLQDDIALPVNDTLQGVTGSQFRGVGASPDDTEVRALGISLNPPQGLGYDLGSFPQYLWSGYQFQLSPALGSTEARAVSGALTFTPWTEAALNRPGTVGRAMGFFSSFDLAETSAAFKASSSAVDAGYSFGNVTGPAGEASTQIELSPRATVRFHVLGEDLDSINPGSINYPSPYAHIYNSRLIPVGQLEMRLDGGAVFKSSVFYDTDYIKYEDPANPGNDSDDHAQQFGAENALLIGNWKFGLSGKDVIYQQEGLDSVNQQIVTAMASRSFEWDSLYLEPTLEAVYASSFGWLPQGSVGVRDEIEPKRWALFARAGLSRKLPTLVDQYYVLPGFQNNPGLLPETDWTTQGGAEFRSPMLDSTLQAYFQYRDNAQNLLAVPSNPALDSVFNVGNAAITAILSDTDVRPWTNLDFHNSFTWTTSNISATSEPFSYMPSFEDVVRAGVHDGEDWRVFTAIHLSSSVYVPYSGILAGSGYMDLGASTHLKIPAISPSFKGRLSAQIQNIFDRPLVWVAGYPPQGMAFSVALSGEF